MKITDIISMGIRNLLRRKVRTLLTVIGVIVGTTAIVVMISLGIGMNASLDESIASMGDLTVITLEEYVYKPTGGDDNGGTSMQNTLTPALVDQIKQIDGVLAVTPFLECWNYNFRVYVGKRYQLQYANLIGVEPIALPYFGYDVTSGSMPTGDDPFILFGSDVIYDIRDPNRRIRDYMKEFYNADGTRKPPKVDVTTQPISIGVYMSDYVQDSTGNYVEKVTKTKKHTLSTIGILNSEDSDDYRTRYYTFIDISLLQEMIQEAEKIQKVKEENSVAGKYSAIMIKAKDIKAADHIQEELKTLGVNTYGLSDIRNEMQKNQSALQMILAGIGAMSLLVAAVGIANTMVMSIYERTREIGVMKVLGCPLYGIRSMFLFEAAMIGLFGGSLGILLSFGASYALNNVPELSAAFGASASLGVQTESSLSIIPWWLIILAVVFGTLIGLISGYLPARRATKISALEAIKNDS